MKLTQFCEAPTHVIRRHAALPLMILSVSLFSGVQEVRQTPLWRARSGEEIVPHSQKLVVFYQSLVQRIQGFPQICEKSIEELTSHQVKQCRQFLNLLEYDLALGSIPIIIPILFYFLYAFWVSFIYHSAHRSVQSRKVKAIGLLMDPMELPMDGFGWWSCLRPVQVRLKDRRIIKVYLSSWDYTSNPGIRVALFKLSPRGQSRYLAIPYLPEISVRGISDKR